MNDNAPKTLIEAAGQETEWALDAAVEALLLASESALSIDRLQNLLAADHPEVGRSAVREALAGLDERLQTGASEVVEVASGWRLQVRSRFNSLVARLWSEKPPRLSRALMETLALIVYRQPVTRGEIEEVRGVSVSTNIMRVLLEREWIRELGQRQVPGRPTLYGTTTQLLDDLGLKSLDKLPELPEIKDPEQLEAALRKLGIEPETLSATGEDEPGGETGNDMANPSGAVAEDCRTSANTETGIAPVGKATVMKPDEATETKPE